MRALSFWIVVVTTLALTVSAWALPRVGATAPAARVQTIDGKTLDTRSLRGNVTLIFYEDKDVTAQNKALKDALIAQKKAPGYKTNVRIHAVADVSSWDFWPAKGFVKDAIQEQERKSGDPIYCDWSGAFGKAFGTTANKSNVVLIGADGKVILTHAGTLPRDKRERILRETGK